MTPAVPSAMLQQAMQHHRAGRLAQAEALYQQVVAQQPTNAAAWGNLGIVLQALGKADQAAECFRRITTLQPNNAQAFNHLGMTLGSAGRFSEAAEALLRATQMDPALAMAFSNLSVALKELGRLHEAERAAQRSIALDGRDPSAYVNLAAARIVQRKHADAIEPSKRAAALDADFSPAYYTLGLAYAGVGKLTEAVAALRRTLELQPLHLEAARALVHVLRDGGQFTDALMICNQLLGMQPDDAALHNLAGSILHGGGQPAEAVAHYRKALQINPSLHESHDGLLLALHYDPPPPREMFEAHLAWARQHTAHLTPIREHRNDRDPDRPLRIGYVSPDFRRHSVSLFLEPPLRAHDRSGFAIYLYSDVASPDATTQRFESLGVAWRDTAALSHEHLCDLVRADEIDILIDCAGHTGKNRLPAFARRPAPIQATYLGYPDTTGLHAIDYRITDAVADPAPAAGALHTEQLVRIDPCAWCYAPAADTRDVPLTARPDGDVTFGSFNTLAKLSPMWMDWCARILARMPRSRLAIKSLALRDAGAFERMRDLFAAHGISGDRLKMLAPHRELSDHLAAYGEIDIALDSFPYNGTTTTCEALWMGVPVITLAGETHVSRVGASLLSAAGLTELIATSPQQFEGIAVALASDVPRRRALRATMRDRLRASPLMDAAGYARKLESAYRDMWRTWCAIRSGDE